MLLRRIFDHKVKLVPVAAFVVVGGCFVYLDGNEAASVKLTASGVAQVDPSGNLGRGEVVHEREPAVEVVPVYDRLARKSKFSPVTESQPPEHFTYSSDPLKKSSGVVSAATQYHDSLVREETDWLDPMGTNDQLIGVNPSMPGHSIASLGVRVAVEAQITDFSGEPKGLEFSVGPEEKVSAGEAEPSNEVERGQAKRSPNIAGFSPEDALFRMKWGWAAYDAAKRMAQESQ